MGKPDGFLEFQRELPKDRAPLERDVHLRPLAVNRFPLRVKIVVRVLRLGSDKERHQQEDTEHN